IFGTDPFVLGGNQIVGAHIQNQGLATGHRSASDAVIGAGAIEAEVNAFVNNVLTTFHVSNDQQIRSVGPNLTLDQFLSTVDVTMTQQNVSAHIQMTTTPTGGHRPTANLSPRPSTVECTCKECTTVEFTSAAGDVDGDLQSLAWTLDTVPTLGENI